MSQPGIDIETFGPFFERDPGATMYQNVMRMVEWLAEQGRDMVRKETPKGQGVDGGFTRGNVEGFTYKRSQYRPNAPEQSAFGKVRLKTGLTRPVSPGTDARLYGPARRPYITMWVIEAGGYGGHRSADRSRAEARSMGRSRTVWVPGSRQVRVAHYPFTKARAKLNVMKARTPIDITEGLS